MELLKNLENPNISDEQKAKIVNEISETFDSLITSDGSSELIECYLSVFINYLSSTPCQFPSESPSQKVINELNSIVCGVCDKMVCFVGPQNYSGDDSPTSGIRINSASREQHPHPDAQLDQGRQRRKCSHLLTDHHRSS